MTPRQIKWARQHDWYVGLTKDRAGITVRDMAYNVHTKETVVSYSDHYDFTELRHHAGY